MQWTKKTLGLVLVINMDIIRYYTHQSIDKISCRYKAFSELKNAQIKKAPTWKWQYHNGTISHVALAAFFGKTGYGKSSTINALMGKKIRPTSHVKACTKECHSLDFKLSPDCFFSLVDFPGIGESRDEDEKYLKMYKEFFKLSTVLVYVIRADTRDYSIDRNTYKQLITTRANKEKVIFALNCCDKIEPIDRRALKNPSRNQMLNIHKKIKWVNSVFEKPVNRIIPYSAVTGWNMDDLADEIVRVVCSSEKVILSSENSY